jgi:zinc/manganese transport system substrate-binding protein
MKLIRLTALAASIAVSSALWHAASAQSGGAPLSVVAAENFYGDVVQQLGGTNVKVMSILTNPDQDPHLFEASASTARALAEAKLVVYNGIDYDPWMEKLLAAHKAPDRKIIVVATLLHRKTGDNPHLWYDPATMPAVAASVTAALEAADPAHGAEYEQRRDAFLASLQPMKAKIESIRQKYPKIVVTATEPVFGYMADALGFTMRNRPFQIAVMNDTEPSPSQIVAFEKDLKSRTVKILFYNNQTTGDLTARLQKLAQDSKVAIVGVTETAPPNTKYQDWMMQQLDAVEKALAAGNI